MDVDFQDWRHLALTDYNKNLDDLKPQISTKIIMIIWRVWHSRQPQNTKAWEQTNCTPLNHLTMGQHWSIFWIPITKSHSFSRKRKIWNSWRKRTSPSKDTNGSMNTHIQRFLTIPSGIVSGNPINSRNLTNWDNKIWSRIWNLKTKKTSIYLISTSKSISKVIFMKMGAKTQRKIWKRKISKMMGGTKTPLRTSSRILAETCWTMFLNAKAKKAEMALNKSSVESKLLKVIFNRSKRSRALKKELMESLIWNNYGQMRKKAQCSGRLAKTTWGREPSNIFLDPEWRPSKNISSSKRCWGRTLGALTILLTWLPSIHDISKRPPSFLYYFWARMNIHPFHPFLSEPQTRRFPAFQLFKYVLSQNILFWQNNGWFSTMFKFFDFWTHIMQ